MEQNKQNQEMEQLRVFYSYIIDDLKHQIADLADQKAVQVAFNNQNKQVIEQLTKNNQILEQKIAELTKE